MVLKKVTMMKVTPSKAIVIKINLFFLTFFLVVYGFLLLSPSTSTISSSWSYYYDQSPAASLIRCSLRECHHKKVEDGLKMKAVLEEETESNSRKKRKMVKREIPSFLSANVSRHNIIHKLKIGLVNMEDEDISDWKYIRGEDIKHIKFQKASKNFEWKDLFPEWIDEEEETDSPTCPEIPMPDYTSYGKFDMVMVKLPCRYPEEGWARDVLRLQVHLIAANLLVKNGRKDGNTKVVFLSECRPMMEIFRCDDMVVNEGNWWLYKPDMVRLQHKISMPIGSCRLALPLWGKGINDVYNLTKLTFDTGKQRREAYVTVLHSSEAYVCGAITLAQSITRTGTKRDLVILIDASISQPKRDALAAAGWKIRMIKRIRNPRAEKDSYNEYNYSKFRLWQLTDYDKVIFIDADIVILRNSDLLFNFPQMSATGNDGSIFNSGIMAIEPSNCTFKILMEKRKEIISYNGGDQGFLNEVFVWWHRWPRRVNFLKNFWANTTLESSVKNHLFGADPPKLYSIHFLGIKPWLCYRDYDCNWNIGDQRVYASDVAHRRWWRVHDAMDKSLQKFCELTPRRRIELDWDKKLARGMGLQDEHWKINISDPRRHV
ncbi:UDP-glucuronate:xylan alpha-glucuronosyltransferase 2-like isoform X1 [Papaver somniferum]|uniref:UDP-glucuronate:xylan alpha-glucuronosyltransferase 2-like isoform X1 n=2 Tax=Papaver somniferum TaxID=3469 RepID=UPI000E6F6A7A|nr:UDP-glucuronate:xylan alpha-glucuronosyltransferase 2-like isoform X1 [Papaver somniferum]